RRAKQQDSALYIARKMNQLALKEQTDTSYWYALSMRYQGNPHYTWGNTDSTIYYWKRSVELFEEYHPESKDYASSLNNLGLVYQKIGDYNAAEPLLKESLEIRKKTLGEEHPVFASGLENLGNFYSVIGNHLAAKEMYMKALEIKKTAFGADHPEVASSLNNLGNYYYSMSNYRAAEPIYQRSLEIRKKTLGEDHLYVAQSLNNLGNLYSDMGIYKGAELLYNLSLDIKKKALGDQHPNVAMSLDNLGNLHSSMGAYKAAEPYYKLSLDINIKAYGEEHPEVAKNLNNLGVLYLKMAAYGDAESLLNQSLKIRKKIFGEQHPDIATNLENLGNLYTMIGDYKIAELLYKKSIEIIKKTLGEEHQYFVAIRNSFAYLLTQTNRELQAYEILNENFTKKSKQIAENFEWLSDNQKEAYWKQESGFYDKLSWFASKAYTKVPEAVALNYNGALITKSKLLETKISKENYYIEVDEIREELSYRKKLLNKLESDGSDKRELMDKLRHEADSLDKHLELSWPAYAEQKRNLLITWDKVRQNLSDGEAAIEFVRFREDEDSAYQYQALIIRKDVELPVLATLCKEEALLDIEPNAGFSAYYPLVWEPMEEHLKDIHTIYYAPSGELYNVPFHAIYSPKGSGDQEIAAKRNKRGEILTGPETESEEEAAFLMDQYTLHQLTSTRYLALGLKKKEKEKPEQSIAMVGGVNYDYLPGQENTKAKKSKKSKNRSSASASGKLAYLEGTKKEAEAINNTTGTKGWETTYLEGNNAKEEKLTQFTDKEAKGILHIATHGYAFPEYSSLDTTIKENSLRYSYRFSQNPMVRSGLILAGGNWAWTGSDTLDRLGAEENGILTALEVSGLNLRNTKLVVLSACETGLGKIEGSEGTFGLKRGFKLAGVEQMIVSLWSVPDEETMELMTLFYDDLTESLNPVKSFEKAQKQMRESYPTRPDLWAGFVLVR
ncbi:CHAT domain-containing protein, partial [Crocinitomicaceae bacterium]|nr:CHAT domain-containing protein [Crocinitomicaceae bacterium]